jgi:putative transmembrane protein PGPGW
VGRSIDVEAERQGMAGSFSFRKRLRVVCGFLILSAGLILAIPGVPGPGIPLVLLGLVILSGQFSWAKRLLDWARQKFNWSGGATKTDP